MSDEANRRTWSEPAFPVALDPDGGTYYGMGPRDWFAGQALSGTLASGAVSNAAPANIIARVAYSVADAMLAERAKGESAEPEPQPERVAYLDRDRRVWSRVPTGWTAHAMGVRTLTQVERKFGPLRELVVDDSEPTP